MSSTLTAAELAQLVLDAGADQYTLSVAGGGVRAFVIGPKGCTMAHKAGGSLVVDGAELVLEALTAYRRLA